MSFSYNKDEIKENLTIEQIYDLLAELGAEPILKNNLIVSRTICHGGSSHKLYYYGNTNLFRCYTECDEVFDVFQLIQKVKKVTLPQAIKFIANFFGIQTQDLDFDEEQRLKDWEVFNNYERIKTIDEHKQIVEFKIFDKSILNNLPQPHILNWEREGISYDVMKNAGIAYDPSNQGIVIPHYDINGNLIGIRERTLIQEEEQYGKYKPAIFNGIMYNHPLGFSLYNLNNSKDNIKIMKKAIIFESEKATLQYASYYGIENDISCACCGSSIINYQIQLLLSLGVQEVVIALDRQYKEIGDDEFKHWTKKLEGFNKKFKSLVNISFIFDKEHNLEYKMSPVDAGKDTFLHLFKERVIL